MKQPPLSHYSLKTVFLYLLLLFFFINIHAQTVTTFANCSVINNEGMAFDAAGNLYVANVSSNTISKITPTGSVSIYVDSGLNTPRGVALDAAGNLYIANETSSTITKVTPTGVISVFDTAGVNAPKGIVFDAAGNLVVSNFGNSTIIKVSPSGTVSTFVSSGLSSPEGITYDAAGNLYVANDGNSVVNKVTPAGVVSTFIGTGLTNPRGVIFDAIGDLYIANVNANTITEVKKSGATNTFVGTSAGLNNPEFFAFDKSGNLYVSNFGDSTINEVSLPPTVSSFTPTSANTGATVTIKGIYFTGATGVSFGGTAASSFTVINDSLMTAVVGNGTSGGVSVTTANGTDTLAGFVYGSLWKGTTSTAWNTGTNWNDGTVPSATINITIPSTASRQPVLSTATTVKNIELDGTLTLNGQTLTLNGTVSGAGTLIGSTTSSLVIGGNVGTINFKSSNNSLNNLTVKGNVSLGNALNIYGTLTATSGTLTTGGFLSLKSISTGTAVVAAVTGSISGNVTVERYIPKGYASFRDLGVCVSGAGTIANTWGQSLNHYKTYSYSSPTWSTVDSTTALQKYKGYRILVTGYKNTVAPATSISYMNSAVTLSYSGSLLTGNQSVPITGGTNKFTFISNPYASQVDFEALTKSGIYDGYWYLDPTTLYGTYVNYDYYGVNIGPSNIYGTNIGKYLQPGQAVFVCSNSASASLTFTESAKNNASTQTAIFGTSTPLNRIATGLFANGKNVDGAVTVFNPNFSNAIAKEDGLKISNQGENLTFNIAGKDLCANGWNTPSVVDELPLHIYQLKTNTAYTLRLDVSLFVGNGLNAYLKDKKLGKQTLLSGDSNIVSFNTTNDTAIYSNRYSIVFSPSTLPVKDINITATQLPNKEVAVRWTVIGAMNVENYTVEHSADGVEFNTLKSFVPNTSNSYSYTDEKENAGLNYYRIKIMDVTGVLSYSKVTQLATYDLQLTTLTVYPNPVTNNSFNIQFGNLATGKYTIDLINTLGQRVYSTTVDHNVSAGVETISLGKQLSAGSYTITATNENGKTINTQVIIK